MNLAPSSSYAADDMTDFIIFVIFSTAPLLGGNSVFLDINKCPPDLLIYFVSERCEALLCPARTISLAWYVIMASGWVAV